MNGPYHSLFVATLLLIPVLGFAQKRKRPAPVVSPIVEADAFTFRLDAPKAQSVSLSGQMIDGKVEMERGEDKIWTATLSDVAPGIYEYSFTVDGMRMLDPGNPEVKLSRSLRSSILRVPGKELWDFRPTIPHGTVHYHAYHSEPIDRFREMQVYTPPGYETGDESYPVLFLQHGHSDSFATWSIHGKAHWIVDNLIADEKAVPMIVVMLDGHPIPSSYGNGRDPNNTEELRKDMLEEVLPTIQTLYRVKSGRENQAIAGLSMGGLHSLTIGLNELENFAWIGAFSAAPPEIDAVKNALSTGAKTNEQLELLWVACGEDDFLLDQNKSFVKALEESEIEHQWLLTEGDHSWPIWRDYLGQFIPLLFQ